MLRIISAIAALTLVAACSSDPETGATNTGAGGSTTTAPAAPVQSSITPGSLEDFVVNVGDRVYFDTDSSSLSSTAQDTLATSPSKVMLMSAAPVNTTLHWAIVAPMPPRTTWFPRVFLLAA